MFGTYGYELDLNKLSEEEQKEVKKYTEFMKQYRRLIQFGTFYRLQSPFVHNESGWMVVNADRTEALVGFYRTLGRANQHFSRLKLAGLDPDRCYRVDQKDAFYGDELMKAGLIVSDGTSGKPGPDMAPPSDFFSRVFHLRAE